MQGNMWPDLGCAQNVALCFHDLLYALGPQQDEESVHQRPAGKRDHSMLFLVNGLAKTFVFLDVHPRKGFLQK